MELVASPDIDVVTVTVRVPHHLAEVGDLAVVIRDKRRIDPETGARLTGSIEEQGEQCLKNIGEILKAAGASFDHVVRTTVFLADMNDFAAMNEAYRQHGMFVRPQLSRLPKEYLYGQVYATLSRLARDGKPWGRVAADADRSRRRQVCVWIG